MAGIIVQLKFLSGEDGRCYQGEGEEKQVFHGVFDKCPMGPGGGAELVRKSAGSRRNYDEIGYIRVVNNVL